MDIYGNNLFDSELALVLIWFIFYVYFLSVCRTVVVKGCNARTIYIRNAKQNSVT